MQKLAKHLWNVAIDQKIRLIKSYISSANKSIEELEKLIIEFDIKNNQGEQ